ncbi:protein kinase domain-containing protein [Streptomyces sp. 6N223]|uniref:protein kinase domain-containing protein n=1 Tax=Streptomyces sp. 6N223 TaxID=3457412 RepID=UPI003FD10D5D
MSDHAAPPPADYTGRAVGGGRYVLRQLLGRGGMASVHLAWDTVLERQVAVKTMHAQLGTEGDFRQRFKREAQAVAKLTHTNIVSVFDTGEDLMDGSPVPYIVMEYVEGKPLRTVLEEDMARFGAMPPEKALAITADVLAALDISHEMGLVHRDIKPGNVMITRRGVVKVMDFGIARAMQQSGVTAMTQTGAVVGTPQYLSPEQALGRAVDARADLYSVGVMLFELLTGRLPFDADTPLAIAYAHVQEEPPTPSSINASLTPAIDALVARMLAKNPNDRFPSAEVLRGEVQRLAGAASGVTPQIVPGAHTPGNSGAGVAQAVFPEYGTPGAAGAAGAVGAQTPPQTPGLAGPAGPAGPYGPHTPPRTPAPPAAYGYPGPQTPSTPLPYGPGGHTPPPGPPGGRRGTGTVMVVAASVVAIALVAAIAVVVILNNGDGNAQADDEETTQSGEPTGEKTGETTPSPTGEESPRYQTGDPTKTIDASECTDADEWYDQDAEPGAVTMPDFYDVHIDSVKACIQAAGWFYEEELTYKDEVLKGEGMVVEQSPEAWEPFNPEEDTIELTVSTGLEPTP